MKFGISDKGLRRLAKHCLGSEEIFYHGSTSTSEVDLSRGLWVTQDYEYAEGYGSGNVIEVTIDTDQEKILDLSDIIVNADTNVDVEALKENLEYQGIDITEVGKALSSSDLEMHQRVPYLINAAQKAGYTAIKIYEWTYDLGEAETLYLFPR